jgi:hypothetical protein
MRELLYIAGAPHHIHAGPCCGSKEARRSHQRGDAIRLALAGVSATLGAIYLIAAGGVERLAAGAHHDLTVQLSHVLATLARFVFRLLRPFLQPAGDGVLQALNEAVVHAKQPLERPSARDLVAGLTTFVSAVQIRRSTN